MIKVAIGLIAGSMLCIGLMSLVAVSVLRSIDNTLDQLLREYRRRADTDG